MTVVIGNGKHVSIAPKGTLAGAQVIDGSGKFLIPSLWDMHVHDWEKTSLSGLYAANGVLGIRDMGSDRKQTRQWQEQMKVGSSGKSVGDPGSGLELSKEAMELPAG
jgi:cytosine/adenosine deaminase-related metal-dependent hydrolase